MQAGLEANDAALDEMVMTDVSPYSMGIETSMHLDATTLSYGHLWAPIIIAEANIAQWCARFDAIPGARRSVPVDVDETAVEAASESKQFNIQW